MVTKNNAEKSRSKFCALPIPIPYTQHEQTYSLQKKEKKGFYIFPVYHCRTAKVLPQKRRVEKCFWETEIATSTNLDKSEFSNRTHFVHTTFVHQI